MGTIPTFFSVGFLPCILQQNRSSTINTPPPSKSTHCHQPLPFPLYNLVQKKSIESLLGPVSSLIFIGTQIVIQHFKFHLICKCSLLCIRANCHLCFSHFTFKPITKQLVGNILYFCIQCSRMLIPDYREFSRLLLSGSNLKQTI